MPGPGGRLNVEPPPRLAPTVSLLTSAEIIPNLPGPNDPTGERWLNGITYRQSCEKANTLGIGCQTDQDMDASEKEFTADDGVVETDPFLVYAGDTCSAMGWETANYVARSQAILAATEAFAVEAAFWDGEYVTDAAGVGVVYPEQTLTSGNSTTVTGGPSDPVGGFGLMQGALAECTGGSRGMIHIPAALLPYLQAHQIVRRDGARYLDGRDNVVVAGAGYPVDGGAGTATIYGTGLVTIRRSDVVVVPGTFAEAMDRTHNHITFLAERYYLVDWDRCCHLDIVVNLCGIESCA